ncbi:dopamine N-acetyltransferase-like isoform X2 [Hyposmocoma kahamanoa]|nr:dopamine N-acetyltransferase-like isoform X2 [Hyposmocoma kahamanoa]
MSKPEYTIDVVKEVDVNDVMALLRRTFYIDEPLNAAIGLCTNNPCTELEEYCKKSILEGLSFKAMDKEGNIVGVCISGVDPVKEPDDGTDLRSQAINCKNPKFQKILYILAMRNEGAKLWEKYPNEQKLVDIKVAGTDHSWRRKGIMNRLVEETEKATKARGINILRMDTSSYYSAKSAERQGFTQVYSVPYTELKMDGVPIIVPDPPHVDDRVYVKILNNN